jgi:hypothetical protein
VDESRKNKDDNRNSAKIAKVAQKRTVMHFCCCTLLHWHRTQIWNQNAPQAIYGANQPDLRGLSENSNSPPSVSAYFALFLSKSLACASGGRNGVRQPILPQEDHLAHCNCWFVRKRRLTIVRVFDFF